MKTFLRISALAALLSAGAALAQSPAEALRGLESAARAAELGAAFFHAPHGRDRSCSSCHTDDPRAAGRHVVTGKGLAPLAPARNAERFSNPAKTEEWFRRNCGDVLGRECTTVEKGNVITYLVSLRP